MRPFTVMLAAHLRTNSTSGAGAGPPAATPHSDCTARFQFWSILPDTPPARQSGDKELQPRQTWFENRKCVRGVHMARAALIATASLAGASGE